VNDCGFRTFENCESGHCLYYDAIQESGAITNEKQNNTFLGGFVSDSVHIH
jgi:hypothetical protein